MLCYSVYRKCFYACPNLNLKLSASQSLFLFLITSSSQHHDALILMCLALSQLFSCRLSIVSHVPCFLSASLTPFLLSPMCLSCLVTVLALSCVHCFVSASRHPSVVSVVLLMCLQLLCPAQHLAALSCALPCLSITLLMCLALSQHAIMPLFSACSAFSRLLDCSTREICPMNC